MSETPLISVIIPVYNDREGLDDTLHSLCEQKSGSPPFEVIVADNGSRDGTWELAQQWQGNEPSRFRAIQEREIQSSYAARNRGLGLARGEIIAFLDADMKAPRDYIEKTAARFRDTDVDYLACAVEIPPSKESLSSLYNSLTGFPVERYLQRGRYAPTCCLCVRRKVFDKIGLFDQRVESGGDMEFGQRVFDAGLNQAFAPEILLTHPPRRRFRSLLNKERRIARGHAQLSFYYPDRYSLFRKLYLGSTKYFFPANPARLLKNSQARKVDLDLPTLAALSVVHLPLSWAGFHSYLEEARRLRRS